MSVKIDFCRLFSFFVRTSPEQGGARQDEKAKSVGSRERHTIQKEVNLRLLSFGIACSQVSMNIPWQVAFDQMSRPQSQADYLVWSGWREAISEEVGGRGAANTGIS